MYPMETHSINSRMGDEKVISSSHHRRYGSQPISVPFLWEQKPGLPKTDWIAMTIPFVGAAISEAKPVCSNEMAIIPLKLIISVPFKWEEKPGKPFPGSTILPASVSSWNPFINRGDKVFDACAFDTNHDSFSWDQNYLSFHGSSNEGDSNQNESWYSVSERDSLTDSSSSAIQNELEVKSCTRNRSHLMKRTLTLGELILLSRSLSCPNNAVFIRKHRFFSMVKPFLA